MKKYLNWISANFKLVLTALLIIILIIFVLWWGRKNKKIKDLENSLAMLQAKLRLQKLAVKKDIAVAELKELRKEDKTVDAKIEEIKKSLATSVESSMTAEEIAAAFREMDI